LSLSSLKNTSFKEVKFEKCKLLGLNFSECNPFLLNMAFKESNLNMASFYNLKIAKTSFINCNLTESDFSESNLEQSNFLNCDLKNTIFNRTNLTKVDFSTSVNYALDPENNEVKQAKFSKDGLEGLLKKHQIIVV
nr:pentapeptide repeat-containing protein [Lutibacter sp.]